MCLHLLFATDATLRFKRRMTSNESYLADTGSCPGNCSGSCRSTELASAARDVVGDSRGFAVGEESQSGNNNSTVRPDVELTHGASPETLAWTVRDSIPRTMEPHERDEVMKDLSVHAQDAYQERERREMSHGRRRQIPRTKIWDFSDMRTSEPAASS
jgi:hypothetical protein